MSEVRKDGGPLKKGSILNTLAARLAWITRDARLELHPIKDHEGYREVSRTEFLSTESMDPLVYSFSGPEDIPAAKDRLAAGETIFGEDIPARIINRQPYQSLPVYAVQFGGCHLYPDWGAVMPSAGTVFDPSVNTARYKSPDLTQLTGISLVDGKPVIDVNRLSRKRLPGRYVLLKHWGGRNYGHFLFDCVPGILLFYDEILQGKLKIVTGHLQPWQRQILNLLGVPADRIRPVSEDSCICEHLIWPSFLKGNLHWPSGFTRRVGEALKRSAAPAGAGPGPELIYISRARHPSRKMINQADLTGALEGLGFTTLHPEDLTVERQIRIFSRAKVVVAETGAGLANLMFAPSGCRVIEIMPELKESQWIKRWCALQQMDWYCIYAPVPPEGRRVVEVEGVKYGNLFFDYSVNVAHVMQAVGHALQD